MADNHFSVIMVGIVQHVLALGINLIDTAAQSPPRMHALHDLLAAMAIASGK